MFHRTRRPRSGAAVTALLAAAAVVATGAAPTAAAASGTTVSQQGSVPDGSPAVRNTAAPQPRGSFGAPSSVRVSTSEAGMYVYATPRCTGWKSCRSWFTIPGYVDVKDVSTTDGYFVPWPSTWREGQSVSSGSVRSFGRDLFGNGWYGTATTSLGTITRPESARPLLALLSSQDDAARKALFVGGGTPDAEIKHDGVTVARADRWGSWSATVAGLPIGTSTVWFEQYVGGRYRDRASVQVTIAGQIRPVTVTGPATVNPGVENVISGTATPNAVFEVRDAAGNVMVPGGPFPVDSTGRWSFRYVVPVGSTELRFRIVQTAWGESVTSELFSLPADTLNRTTITKPVA